MNSRVLLFAAASAAALVSTHAFAQAAPAAAAQVEELVVTGSRADPRSRLESLSPVDVVNATALQRQGTTELGAALAVTVPSIDFPRPSNTDGTDAIRPATLRGQGPDQTLVLLNGARAHTSALVNLNGSVGRGSAAVDLNTIPTVSIDHIEVLRDGASALYGSDAIAGVIAIKLREADHGGGASATYGQYQTSFDGFVGGKRSLHDGATKTIDAWQGFQLGSDGFLTVSGEYLDRGHTNRSDVDPRFNLGVTSRFGDGDVHQETAFLNAGKPLGEGWEIYGWAGGQKRHTETAATFRAPNDAVKNIASVYPNGFVPHISSHSDDYTLGSALKGEIAGWKANFSVDDGWNKIRYDTIDTLNASLGPTSPHQFYAGKMIYSQVVGNADFSRDFDVGMAGPLNVAFGAEARQERYKIGAGEANSYIRGPFTTLGIGAQGFPGFLPDNVVDKSRTNEGAYLALEGKVLEPLTLSGALREEHYSDFGNNTSGKVSFRYEVTPFLAFRGSAESGFRAPSLQQEYFTSTASLFVNNVQFDTGTFPSTSPTGLALGGKPLKPEKSKNYSLGAVFHMSGVELTVDGYEIDVKDRIVLSETLTGSASAAPGTNARVIADLLAPFGATAARFFLNGVDTKTRGVDVVATYRLPTQPWGSLNLTASGNINDFEVTKTPATQQTVLPIPVSLFARQAVYRFERGTPKYKATLQGDWSLDDWGATGRVTYYGDVLAPGTTNDGLNDIHTGAHAVVDLEARYSFPHGVQLAVGADNLFDEYPDQIPVSRNGVLLDSTGAAPWSSFSPFGFNGRFVYGRLSVTW
ncbi:TonB-dependent receptor [Phenylobacterium sp.]|uniref:TonB-dependent receptor plug domain-containing protein n=1 Tax=Phenylobacterium sp. TaxID=1871053 RepID=UPI002DF17538|nr:TonB-dependent receptor [Phenylobacterium sp.]